MDRFQEMQAFVAVVETGSFVRGADALQMSKSVASRLVGDLEQRLGVRLLQRTTRRLSLTREGERFHERCRELLAGLGEAEDEVTRHAGELRGELRISAPVSFGLMHLAPLWPAFLARHPHLTLDVDLGDRLVDLVDEGYDLAVRIAQLASSSLVTRKLASTRLILCASPTYLRTHGTPADPAALAQHPVFTYKLLSTGEQWHFSGPQGPCAVKVSPRMRSNSGDSCCEAALQHQGLVLQPSFMVGAHLRSGALVEVLPQYRSVALGIYAVYPSRKQLAPKVRGLVEPSGGKLQGAGLAGVIGTLGIGALAQAIG
ncbi:LysR family transcriptional regulator [Aquabacterium sp. OR-4]|uniref:LysR family transcriptional regulator n=1 Tax=Aquabacterium sp. OR-4 TaxID=2978127 RepID=UPI0028C93C8D|nr:LysR family transcriptional regulator [Aquabacterium sp. OR-4]MDT7838559.1 LysR family transcriptional regulator [Aquabacterium sp. OR-4]